MDQRVFIPGLRLGGYLFEEAIRPLMAAHFPNMRYAAACLDYGSDVLSFDTPMSMDHGWGPKMTLFFETEETHTAHHTQVDAIFANNLPLTIHGFPTHFGEPLADGGVMASKTSHPIHHMISLTTPARFFMSYVGVDISTPLTAADWLAIPQQRLRTLRAGRIYHDDTRTLTTARAKLDWYLHDIWLYLMACQWQRISQDEAFIGRTGQVGDDAGSRLLAARIIQSLMVLVFLMEKRYPPYHKWFGTAFNQLAAAPDLLPIFRAVFNATDWKTREKHLSEAYIYMIRKHNALQLTEPVPAQVTAFHNRPFLVPHAARLADALQAQITDPAIQALPKGLGSIDTITDNTDVLENIPLCKKIITTYQAKNEDKEDIP